MSQLIASKLNKGISPERFFEGMTKNQDTFKSWSDRFEWNDAELEEFYDSLNNRDDLRCLILAADWCGDVVRNVPVVFQAMSKAGIPTEVLIMEENLDLMDQHLTMGGRAIPVVLFTDTGGHLLGKWGARPKYVQEVMNAFKAENPDREAPDYQEKIMVARQEMMRRYGEDTGYQTIILQEIRDILSGV
ncbi:thioredoxin family protein [Cohnella endophytica]|uniref:Thioredoxin family protein n=1 Tax=Cohnella endophytica TaxID=2419778 RepID=A0A494XCE8_9BACL|nr:thioredoxin family protein [Cohnella endophytica]RKP45814.1 thioredoxin family protein [Cohnella endophytica]